jgi:hypothetical protein
MSVQTRHFIPRDMPGAEGTIYDNAIVPSFYPDTSHSHRQPYSERNTCSTSQME